MTDGRPSVNQPGAVAGRLQGDPVSFVSHFIIGSLTVYGRCPVRRLRSLLARLSQLQKLCRSKCQGEPCVARPVAFSSFRWVAPLLLIISVPRPTSPRCWGHFSRSLPSYCPAPKTKPPTSDGRYTAGCIEQFGVLSYTLSQPMEQVPPTWNPTIPHQTAAAAVMRGHLPDILPITANDFQN